MAIYTSLAPRETPITPSAVDWYAPDFGGRVHVAAYVDAEAGDDQ
jgi:hypothetical protein